IGAVIEERERELAAARRGGGHKGNPGNFPELGQTRDKVAESLGVSGRTYEKAKAVIEAANDNEKFAPLVEGMDRTGKVNGAFKKLRKLQGEGHHDLASDAKPAPVYSDAHFKCNARSDLD